jgi:hypothetical protein
MAKAFDECFGKDDILTFAEIESLAKVLSDAYDAAEIE